MKISGCFKYCVHSKYCYCLNIIFIILIIIAQKAKRIVTILHTNIITYLFLNILSEPFYFSLSASRALSNAIMRSYIATCACSRDYDFAGERFCSLRLPSVIAMPHDVGTTACTALCCGFGCELSDSDRLEL